MHTYSNPQNPMYLKTVTLIFIVVFPIYESLFINSAGPSGRAV